MVHPLTPADAMAWIRNGIHRVQSEPARWLGLTFIYFVVALLLKFIPFFGNYVIVLISPIPLASALMITRENTPSVTPTDALGWVRAVTIDAARDSLRVFREEDHSFAIIIVCIVTLGMTMLVSLPELMFAGGSIVSGIAAADIGGGIPITTLIGIIVVLFLYLLLTMALFFMVPLTMLGERYAIPAIVESFETCKKHARVLATFVAPFFAINFVMMLVFSVSHAIGYLLLASVGMVALPTFVIGLNDSYRALFESSSTAASTSNSTQA